MVHLRNGRYGLIEVKIGWADLINKGASSLKTLSDKIDTTRMKKPSLAVAFLGRDSAIPKQAWMALAVPSVPDGADGHWPVCVPVAGGRGAGGPDRVFEAVRDLGLVLRTDAESMPTGKESARSLSDKGWC